MISGPAIAPGRCAESNDGEQPLALLLGVDVVGERPELRDNHHVEDANPQEERHAEHGGGHTGIAQREK